MARSFAVSVLAAVAEIGGAWLVWQGVRKHRGLVWVGAGVAALGAYGFVATLRDGKTSGGYWAPAVGSRRRLTGVGCRY